MTVTSTLHSKTDSIPIFNVVFPASAGVFLCDSLHEEMLNEERFSVLAMLFLKGYRALLAPLRTLLEAVNMALYLRTLKDTVPLVMWCGQ